MGRTAYQKIVDSHTREELVDGSRVLELDRVWCHEITTPPAIIDARGRGCDLVFDPNKVKAMIDHVTPAKDSKSAIQGKIMRNWSEEQGVEFLDVGRNGVCHAIIPEKGWIRPGEIGIMGDSHTCTHGAFCALAAGVGTSILEAGLITGLWLHKPGGVIRVNFNGALPDNVFSKDMILALLREIGTDGATGCVLEFGGSAFESLSMDARMTITNMAVETGATSGMGPVDIELVAYLEPTIAGFKDHKEILKYYGRWNSDPDADYDRIVNIDVSKLEPLVATGTSPGDVETVKSVAGTKIDQVYIGSCTNGRLEDLVAAAEVFRRSGKKLASNIRCVVVPATAHIWKQADELGLLKIFMDAGCCVTNPTCGACLGMSNGVLAPEEICLSTTNRNFPGRMGKGGSVILASPATAAMSAIVGSITLPESDLCSNTKLQCPHPKAVASDRENVKNPQVDYSAMSSSGSVGVEEFSGKVIYLTQKSIDTDQIIPAKYLTETDKKSFGVHCLEDCEMDEVTRCLIGQAGVLIAGANFGCGSSREQAPWALAEAGIRCVIAPSFARIFKENMFANGLLCISLDDRRWSKLVEDRPRIVLIDLQVGKIDYFSDSKQGSFGFSITLPEKELLMKGGIVPKMLSLATDLQEKKGVVA